MEGERDTKKNPKTMKSKKNKQTINTRGQWHHHNTWTNHKNSSKAQVTTPTRDNPTLQDQSDGQQQIGDWEAEAKPCKHNRALKPTPSNSTGTGTWGDEPPLIKGADATRVFTKEPLAQINARGKEIHQQRLYHWASF